MKKLSMTEVKVGAAVGFTVLLLIITIILLGGDNSFFTETYKVRVAFDKVESLSTGAIVRLSGYQVGNVSKIEFSEQEQKIVVTMTILGKYKNKITSTSIAGLRTQGALGDKYIYISPGREPGKILKDGDFIQAESSEDLLSTITQRGGEITKIFDVLKELHTFSQQLNHDGRSEKLMKNMTKASEDFQKAMETLALALQDLRGEDGKNIKKFSKHLVSISEKIDNGSGTLGGLVNDSSVHDRLKTILGGSQRTELKTLLQTTIQEGKK
jgi:phospholipid/cholesterol/gamma-HCH transport system substrate-binding protein